MKATELRIGNIVFYNSEDDKNEPVRYYCTINGADLRIMQDDENYLKSHEPIPLTPELLEKCGFSDKDYKSGYIGIEIKAGGMITDFVLTKPQVLGEFQKQFCWEYTAGNIPFFLKLEYLHQLQNLYFSLTCKELEINLEEK